MWSKYEAAAKLTWIYTKDEVDISANLSFGFVQKLDHLQGFIIWAVTSVWQLFLILHTTA